MASSQTSRQTIHYDKPGTLLRPKIIGRLLRFCMGTLCLAAVWDLVMHSSAADLYNPSWWFLAGIGLLCTTYVVNIGFGLSIGNWPRNSAVLVLLLVGSQSYVITGEFLGTPLWITANFWLVYIFGHLGVSFLLASLLATPGCEMRAIPQLFGLTRGREVAEHYCPALIDNVDKWEHGISVTAGDDISLEFHSPESKDLLRSGGQMLMIYGLPFVALQLAGNLGGFRVATLVPALAFFAVSLVCLINIARCKRVHCYFLAPWLFTAAALLVLYSFRLFDFGLETWSLIVNTALFGGVCISVHMEMSFGKYFGKT